MKKTAYRALLISAIVGLTATRTLSQPNRIPAIPNLSPGDAVPNEYIVKLKPAEEIGFLNIENVGRLLGGVVKTRFQGDPNLIVLKKDKGIEATYKELYSSDLVEYVAPNSIYHMDKTPNDADYEKAWGMRNIGDKRSTYQSGTPGMDINVEKAWDVTTGSKDVVVAIIDTGIDLKHSELKDNLWTNEKELNGKPGVDDDENGYVDDIYGYDFYNNKGDPQDDHGHGTHCAGVIGAKGDNGVGVAGVNWNVKIMALKFLSDSGSGTAEGAIKAIDYATAMGARLSSNSWGGTQDNQALKEAIQRAEAKGVLFVAAAGNDSDDNDVSGHFPANFDLSNIISVAAVDNTGALATFSNYGKTKVHVAAPGVDIYSTFKDGGYETMSGTSMATPHVAGVAALALSKKDMSMADLRAKVVSSVRALPSLDGKVSSGGIIDAYKAVQ